MKILVTGTAGFIGFHLARQLLQRGNIVIGIDNINDYYDAELKYARLNECGISRDAENWNKTQQSKIYPGYKFIRMNLEDINEIEKLFRSEDFDIVCNLAAQAGVRYSLENPQAYISSNIVGFMNILEACRHNNIKHLVYASSSSVYGSSSKMPLSTTDNVDHPISLYAATKKSNELMAYTYSHLFGLPTTGLRFFTVYGPWGRPDMAPILFADAISKGKPIKVFNHGNLERDFTYIDDIVEGVIKILDNPPLKGSDIQPQATSIRKPDQIPYKIYNIGNSAPVNLISFIETIEMELGIKAIKEFLPMQPGDVLKTYADVSELKTDFGYEPETSLEKGIESFIKWFRSYYSI